MATATEKVIEIKKNAADVIRVQPTVFNGIDLVDCRVYVEGADGKPAPTKKGLCLRPEVWPDVITALEEVLSV